MNMTSPKITSITKGIHTSSRFPWKAYIAANNHKPPIIKRYLDHHVFPPASGAFKRLFVKYKYNIPIAIENNSILHNLKYSIGIRVNRYASKRRNGMHKHKNNNIERILFTL